MPFPYHYHHTPELPLQRAVSTAICSILHTEVNEVADSVFEDYDLIRDALTTVTNSVTHTEETTP